MFTLVEYTPPDDEDPHKNQPRKKSSLKRLYSIKDAAVYLSLSTWTVRDMTHKGTLPFVRLGKRILIAIEDLEHLIAMHKECPDGIGL